MVASISTLPLALASPAWAVVKESFVQAGVAGFNSKPLTDDGGSGGNKVDFTGCHTDLGRSVTVQLRRAVIGPDTGFDTKTYTACFNGGTSSGEWGAGTEGHDYYFRITEVDGNSIVGPTISVDKTRMSF
ncbi:hypothetical protein PV728_21075 [Streptomyces europaeiscabiei]|uniref:hypothetical protein n=1 Tax=Streptomyces TaxID=1883 RepID=UPI00117C6A2B|nr:MULTISPECIES: hypothetical protein [Streptomyces]MDX3632717.1 hypothetical protein [Streptomyces europaeiscabiei]MDX3653009.1 hypothetical protein [Streptomyces europaeiscabiei]WUD34073.1 hypothetical protein OG858_23490 [Streptomyces europaeiscabiei]